MKNTTKNTSNNSKLNQWEFFEMMGYTRRTEQMRTRSGKGWAKDQQIIYYQNGCAFFSYGTLIAAFLDGKLYLTSYHDYSNTTIKYCNYFTNLNTEQRRKGLKSGEIGFIE